MTEQPKAKKTPTRIYRVNETLIRATNAPVAVNHLVKRTVHCRVATQEDIVELRDLGLEIQEAGTEWKESAALTVTLTSSIEISDAAAAAMQTAAAAAAEIPGATEKDITAAALESVRVESVGRTAVRILSADESHAEVKGGAEKLLGLGAEEDPAALGASDDPAVLGGGDPAVLTDDEIDEIEDELGEAGMASRFAEFEAEELSGAVPDEDAIKGPAAETTAHHPV